MMARAAQNHRRGNSSSLLHISAVWMKCWPSPDSQHKLLCKCCCIDMKSWILICRTMIWTSKPCQSLSTWWKMVLRWVACSSTSLWRAPSDFAAVSHLQSPELKRNEIQSHQNIAILVVSPCVFWCTLCVWLLLWCGFSCVLQQTRPSLYVWCRWWMSPISWVRRHVASWQPINWAVSCYVLLALSASSKISTGRLFIWPSNKNPRQVKWIQPSPALCRLILWDNNIYSVDMVLRFASFLGLPWLAEWNMHSSNGLPWL